MTAIVIIWLFIISDGTAGFMGARAAYLMKNAEGNRPEWASAFCAAQFLIGVGSYGLTVNNVVHSTGQLPDSKWYIVWAVVFRICVTTGLWGMALVLMNGHDPGMIRRATARVIKWVDRRLPQPPPA